MVYIVEFGIDVISKRNLISRKNGDIEVTTDATVEELNWEDNKNVLKEMICADVQPKVKQKIFNVEILKIYGK